MNKSILWYQHPDANSDDVMFLNGKKMEQKPDERRNFQIVSSLANMVIRKATPWCGKVNGHFFMKGYLDLYDKSGRQMCFLYATDSNDILSALHAELAAAGVSLTKETKLCLSRYNHKNRVGIWTIAIVAAIVALMVLAIVSGH